MGNASSLNHSLLLRGLIGSNEGEQARLRAAHNTHFSRARRVLGPHQHRLVHNRRPVGPHRPGSARRTMFSTGVQCGTPLVRPPASLWSGSTSAALGGMTRRVVGPSCGAHSSGPEMRVRSLSLISKTPSCGEKTSCGEKMSCGDTTCKVVFSHNSEAELW